MMKHFTTDEFVMFCDEDIIEEWFVEGNPNAYDKIPHNYWDLP